MKKSQNFDDLMRELEQIVEKLSDEATPLEDALLLYADAAKKLQLCSDKLQNAEVQITEIQNSISKEMKNSEL